MQCLYVLFSVLLLIILSDGVNGQLYKNPTFLDLFTEPYHMYRNIEFRAFGRISENPRMMSKARQKHMLQNVIPPSESFPCNVTGFRSPEPPTSVHKVRPGDIDIIAALGDSLTAGNGLVATELWQIFVENRGLSFSIGGQGTWREFITLPNILKEFNPNIFGYSLRDSLSYHRESQFNPAERGAFSNELPYMTKVLIQRIKKDPRVRMNEHWKLITLWIGANDFCFNVCYQNEKVLSLHREDMLKILRLIRDNLPRTIVNVIPPLNVLLLSQLYKKPAQCNTINWIECYCVINRQYKNQLKRYSNILEKWQEIDEEVSNLAEFKTDDFAILFHPYLKELKLPKNNNDIDYSAFSQDCFHFSQKVHAVFATGLWNSMLEKNDNKTQIINVFNHSRFLCPTEENPYIATNF